MAEVAHHAATRSLSFANETDEPPPGFDSARNRRGERGAFAVAESDHVEGLLEDKDRELANAHVESHAKIEQQQQDANRLIHAVRTQGVACKNLDELTTEELQRTASHVTEELQSIRVKRNQTETRLEKLTDERIGEAKARLLEENDAREKSCKYTREISMEVCRLYTEIETARSFRIEKGQKLAEAVSSKLDEIREAVAAEQRIRLESEETLLKLLGDMGSKMEKEMADAKREREESEERLLQLMEHVLPQMADPKKNSWAIKQHSETGAMTSQRIEASIQRSATMRKASGNLA